MEAMGKGVVGVFKLFGLVFFFSLFFSISNVLGVYFYLPCAMKASHGQEKGSFYILPGKKKIARRESVDMFQPGERRGDKKRSKDFRSKKGICERKKKKN